MDDSQPALAKPGHSIGSRMARGAAWMVVLRSADRLLGFASMLVLARLLVPADFGLVALGMAVVGSLAAFSEFSFDMALIQNQSAKRKHYDTAWTLGLLRGLLLACLLLLIARPAATIMENEQIVGLVSIMAVFPLLEGLTNIGVVDFRKRLVFGKEFQFIFSSRLGGVITTISLAILWQDYWALVAGQFANRGLKLLLSYGLHPYRPRLSLAAWRDLFHFSKWLFLNGIFAMISNRLPTFMIGAHLNVTSVGLFSMSAEISSVTSQAFIAPIKRVLFPGFSAISHEPTKLRKAYYEAHSLVVLIALPVTIGIGITSDLFVPFLLGEKWIPTIEIIQILVLNVILVAAQGQIRPILLATNRPHIAFYLTAFYGVLLFPLLTFGLSAAGLLGAAWALVCARLAYTAAEYWVLVRTIGLSAKILVARVWRSAAASILMVYCVTWSKSLLPLTGNQGFWGQILDFAVIVIIGVAAYLSSVAGLWLLSRQPKESAETMIVLLVKRRLTKAAKST